MSNFVKTFNLSVSNIGKEMPDEMSEEMTETTIRNMIQMDIKGNILDMNELNRTSKAPTEAPTEETTKATTETEFTSTFRMAFDPKYQKYLESVYGTTSAPKQYKDDIGIDLYVPENIFVGPFETKFINLGIRAEYQGSDNVYYGYQLYPRSSISKTKLRLANSVGIIDPNYRGYLIAAVDNISDTTQYINKGDRLFQLVFVQLTKPTSVEIITEDQLSSTDRGTGGFGSTGK
jgi:dUTP pyrophosphatase